MRQSCDQTRESSLKVSPMNDTRVFPDPDHCRTVHAFKNLYDCLTEDAFRCPYAISFGNGYYCQHQDRCGFP